MRASTEVEVLGMRAEVAAPLPPRPLPPPLLLLLLFNSVSAAAARTLRLSPLACARSSRAASVSRPSRTCTIVRLCVEE